MNILLTIKPMILIMIENLFIDKNIIDNTNNNTPNFNNTSFNSTINNSSSDIIEDVFTQNQSQSNNYQEEVVFFKNDNGKILNPKILLNKTHTIIKNSNFNKKIN